MTRRMGIVVAVVVGLAAVIALVVGLTRRSAETGLPKLSREEVSRPVPPAQVTPWVEGIRKVIAARESGSAPLVLPPDAERTGRQRFPDEPSPLGFPEGVKAPYAPSAFGELAPERVRECNPGLEPIIVDCSEFPCMVWARTRDPKLARFRIDGCARWKEAFPDRTFTVEYVVLGRQGAPEVWFKGWMPLAEDRELLPVAFRRVQLRGEELYRALR